MKKLYGGLKMSWLNVLLFGLAAGIYTGLVMTVPALHETSFQDIGIMYEWWVIFAVIIVVNCQKPVEAMLKCFVFFLISQPTVYAVEVIAGHLELAKAITYYRQFWFMMTILTLPGGFIAYFCKKQNMLGAVVLGLGNTIQLLMAAVYFVLMLRDFPHHLLSMIVSIVSMVVMSVCIQQEKGKRLVAMLLPIVLFGALFILLKVSGRTLV